MLDETTINVLDAYKQLLLEDKKGCVNQIKAQVEPVNAAQNLTAKPASDKQPKANVKAGKDVSPKQVKTEGEKCELKTEDESIKDKKEEATEDGVEQVTNTEEPEAGETKEHEASETPEEEAAEHTQGKTDEADLGVTEEPEPGETKEHEASETPEEEAAEHTQGETDEADKTTDQTVIEPAEASATPNFDTLFNSLLQKLTGGKNDSDEQIILGVKKESKETKSKDEDDKK